MPVTLNLGKLAHFEPSQRQSQMGVVPWSPPQSNWNPWTSSNIDEGPLAYVSTILFLRSDSSVLLLKYILLGYLGEKWIQFEVELCVLFVCF